MQTIRAVVRDGKIVPLEAVRLPNDTEVLVTPVTEDADFWSAASQASLDAVWNNAEDDVYAELLKE